jgi:hypothetical protein
MQIGELISWGEVPSLGLPAFEDILPESGFRREVKIYKVPTELSETRYFVSVKEGAQPEEVPPSLIRETDLLVHFTIDASGQAQLIYGHPAVRAA